MKLYPLVFNSMKKEWLGFARVYLNMILYLITAVLALCSTAVVGSATKEVALSSLECGFCTQ